MLLLLITNNESLIDLIVHYINKISNTNIKLLIATSFPNNYNIYDCIITESNFINDQWNSINGFLIVLSDTPYQWIRQYNFFNLLLPLNFQAFNDILKEIHSKQFNYYPYLNIQDKNEKEKNAIETIEEIKDYQNELKTFHNNINNFYEKFHQQIDQLESKILNNISIINNNNNESVEIPLFVEQKIFKTKLIIDFNNLDINNCIIKFFYDKSLKKNIKDWLTNYLSLFIELIYFFLKKKNQLKNIITLEINCCIENNNIHFKINVINENNWDPQLIIFLQNYFILNINIINKKKIFFNENIIDEQIIKKSISH